MLRHILIKLTEIKNKERLLKAPREKQQVTYKGKPTLTVDHSAETLQARWEWQDTFKVLKEKKKSTTKISLPRKISFNTDLLMEK